MKTTNKNIYQIYNDNGRKCPFVVQRDSWENVAFVVESIGGITSGMLSGRYPYYNNAPVLGFTFDFHTGERIEKRSFDACDGSLSCAGNYSWRLVEE